MTSITEKVSVIIPIYNIERYVDRCVMSVINQDYKDLEIILVDDGSTDDSGKKCDYYATIDERVSVIHKENGGLSDARNTGLMDASGKYVTFIDGDDYVSEHFVGHLVDAIQRDGSDIAVSGYINTYDGDNTDEHSLKDAIGYRVIDQKTCFKDMMYQNGIDTNACSKLYYLDLFKERKYPYGQLYEDIKITCEIIGDCRKIAVIDNIDYFYYQRYDSIQYQEFSGKKMYAVESAKYMVDYISERYEGLREAAITRYFNILCNIFFQIRQKEMYFEEYSMIWNEIKTIRSTVLKNSEAKPKSRIAALLSYYGPSVFRRAYLITQKRGAQLRKR